MVAELKMVLDLIVLAELIRVEGPRLLCWAEVRPCCQEPQPFFYFILFSFSLVFPSFSVSFSCFLLLMNTTDHGHVLKFKLSIRNCCDLPHHRLFYAECLAVGRGQRRMTILLPADRKGTATQITTRFNQVMQKSISTTAEDHAGCSSCQVRSGNWGYNSQGLVKIGQKKIRKTLHGLVSLDFCCNIHTVGSKLGVNNMKTWISLLSINSVCWWCNSVFRKSIKWPMKAFVMCVTFVRGRFDRFRLAITMQTLDDMRTCWSR